jgi:Lon protease-like protein
MEPRTFRSGVSSPDSPVSLLPLFPLPNVVLFPGVVLPLHIFEPRYREMVNDALESDRRIGMVLLRAGWEADYQGRPPVHAVACSGVIVHSVRLDDGRYNIVLRGLDRVRIVEEDDSRAYRRATIQSLPDAPLDDADRRALSDLRLTLDGRLGTAGFAEIEARGFRPTHLAALPDEEFIHTLSQCLDLEPIEKQALLECDTLRARAESLLELLEMKRLTESMPGAPGLPH